jgi:hypothetical protein
MERRPEDLAVEEGVKEVLALAKAQRPKNTQRCYLPKQKEWKACSPLLLAALFHLISLFLPCRSIANLWILCRSGARK